MPKPGRAGNDRRGDLSERKWLERLRMPLPVSPADAPYFGSRMHDSSVLGIERDKGVLRVRLDAIDARDFAGHLVDALGLDPVETVWPIDLLLHDVTYVRAAREDRLGGLRFVDPARLAEGGPEFLYDWFHESDGRLQWIAHLYVWPEHRTSRENDVYLMVDCARATAEDRCAAVLGRHFGVGGRLLYEDARAEIDEAPIDFAVFDSYKTEGYIRRRIAARGLKARDFSPTAAPDIGA